MIYPKDGPLSLDTTVTCLKSGGIAVLPTDTIYGLSGIVDLENSSSFGADEKIRNIKGRAENKPFIHLIEKPEDIYRFTDTKVPDSLLEKWPGALSIIVSVKKGSPLEREGKTVAFRCPGDPWLRKVIKECGAPIYSTSVNLAGKTPLYDLDEIEKEFGKKVSLIIRDVNLTGERKPSTIVELKKNGKYTVKRQGAVEV